MAAVANCIGEHLVTEVILRSETINGNSVWTRTPLIVAAESRDHFFEKNEVLACLVGERFLWVVADYSNDIDCR